MLTVLTFNMLNVNIGNIMLTLNMMNVNTVLTNWTCCGLKNRQFLAPISPNSSVFCPQKRIGKKTAVFWSLRIGLQAESVCPKNSTGGQPVLGLWPWHDPSLAICGTKTILYNNKTFG